MASFKGATNLEASRSTHDSFSPAPQGFIELNFDGASKGNPGLVGFNRVFLHCNSSPVRIYAQSCGIASIDLVKFMALEQGIHITIREGFRWLQIEGDSVIAIQCAQKIMNGQPLSKKVKSWQLKELWKILRTCFLIWSMFILNVLDVQGIK